MRPERHRRLAETAHQDPDERGEGSDLDRGGHEARHRGRRAVVHVRHPHVKRDRRHLEREPRGEQRRRGEEQRGGPGRAATGRRQPHRVRHVREARRPRRAVRERGAVQEDRRREGPEHEVLESGLRGPLAAPQVGGQAIDGQRHHLQGNEDDDEVGGLPQKAHAGSREERQRVVLPAGGAEGFQVAEGHEAREHESAAHHGRDDAREPVGDRRAGEQRRRGVSHLRDRRPQAERGEDRSEPRLVPAIGAGRTLGMPLRARARGEGTGGAEEHLGGEQHQRADGEDERRQHALQVGRIEVHRSPSARAAPGRSGSGGRCSPAPCGLAARGRATRWMSSSAGTRVALRNGCG